MKNIDLTKLNKDFFVRHKVALAYVFGSFVRGKLGPLSDLDFGILFSKDIKPKDYPHKEALFGLEIEKIISVKADIINLAKPISPLLRHNAVFSGRSIFTTDKKIRFSIENAARKEFEDTKILRSRQYGFMLKRVKAGVFGKAGLTSQYMKKYVSPQ